MSENRFQEVFRGAVKLYGGVRATGRLLGISPSTVSRLNRGDPADPKTANILGPALGVCACCGQDWPKESEPAGRSMLSAEQVER